MVCTTMCATAERPCGIFSVMDAATSEVRQPAHGTSFDELVSRALEAPIKGWNFDWLQGRATEDRTSWHYAERARALLATASSALDLDTGGGEVLTFIASFPPRMVATESWPPNVEFARKRLGPLGVEVVDTTGEAMLPFSAESFDVVLSRHPVRGRSASADAAMWWHEAARVLRRSGRFFSQQVGGRGMQELAAAMGRPPSASKEPWNVKAAARMALGAGLVVDEAREEFVRTVFFDIGAVVYYLRLVIWIVPGFSVETHREHLRRLDERIRAEGPLVTHGHRILLSATKP